MTSSIPANGRNSQSGNIRNCHLCEPSQTNTVPTDNLTAIFPPPVHQEPPHCYPGAKREIFGSPNFYQIHLHTNISAPRHNFLNGHQLQLNHMPPFGDHPVSKQTVLLGISAGVGQFTQGCFEFARQLGGSVATTSGSSSASYTCWYGICGAVKSP